MRSPNPERILSTIKGLAPSLSREDLRSHRLVLTLAVLLAAVAKQLDISEFTGGESGDGISSDSRAIPSQADPDEARDTGIIYARVSTRKQAEEGVSLESQVSTLQKIATREEIPLECDPIKDEGKTGTSFDRDGIQEVFQRAKKDRVAYLLVQDIDRIGRAAAETLYFIYILQTECDVVLVTPSGEQDITSTRGLMQATLMSLMGQLNNDLRIRKSNESTVRSFIANKNWRANNPVIPIGYEETDDGWIEKIPEMEDVVRDIFREFLDCEYYAETKRRVTAKHGNVFEGHRVKTCLQEHAYIGRPQIAPESVGDYQGKRVRDDPELQMVDEETFDRAQEVIERKNELHSTSDEAMGIIEFVEEFDLFTVVEASNPVELRCEVCGGDMVKEGQRELTRTRLKGHMYRCKECGTGRKWPRDDEYDRMELLQKLPDLPKLLKRLTDR